MKWFVIMNLKLPCQCNQSLWTETFQSKVILINMHTDSELIA